MYLRHIPGMVLNTAETLCKQIMRVAAAAVAVWQGVAKRLDKSKTLEPTCKSALYRRALEDSEDIRYDYRASQACQADRTKFCPDVQPGKGRVIECLENHIKDKEFSGARPPNACIQSHIVHVEQWPTARHIPKAMISNKENSADVLRVGDVTRLLVRGVAIVVESVIRAECACPPFPSPPAPCGAQPNAPRCWRSGCRTRARTSGWTFASACCVVTTCAHCARPSRRW